MNEINPEFEPTNELMEIKLLPSELGFNITDKLREIKINAMEQLVKFPDHINFAPEVIKIMTDYQIEGEKIVDSKENDEDRIKALLGHQIDRINMLIESNWNKDFIIIEIDEAIFNAHNEGFDEIVAILQNLKNKLQLY